MSKKFYKKNRDPKVIEDKIRHIYLNKYYNLYMNSVDWDGLTAEERDYVMRRFWAEGTCAAFKINGTEAWDGSGGVVGFAPWATQTWNMYDFPETVLLINQRGVPFIPSTPQVVNKDVALGWFQRNHKPVREIVEYYIDRIVQVEMVINTNLELQKMPYLVGVTPEDKDRIKDVIDRILNNELVVYADMKDLALIKSIITESPYIGDKLIQHRITLENELLTYLGIDNIGQEKKERLIVDEVNATNDLINRNGLGFIDTLTEWTDVISDLFGKKITPKPAAAPVSSINEGENGKGEIEDKEDEYEVRG